MQRLVYILSPSFSGSTLLTLLLAQHERIATVGELKASAFGDVDRYMCSCGSAFLQCPFWQLVEARMQERGMPFSLKSFGTHFRSPGRPVVDRLLRSGLRHSGFETARQAALRIWPGASRAYQRIMDQNLAMIDVILDMTGADIFLDGSKDAHRLDFFRRQIGLDLRVLYLVRDGRGATNSYRNHTQTDIREASIAWKRSHAECGRVLSWMHPRRCLQIRYEALCTEPEAILQSVHRFLEVSATQHAPAYTPEAQHILGNSMRLRPLQNVRLDEKWREQMTSDDLLTFAESAGKLNAALQYQ